MIVNPFGDNKDCAASRNNLRVLWTWSIMPVISTLVQKLIEYVIIGDDVKTKFTECGVHFSSIEEMSIECYRLVLESG
jgi:hypothetical protein